MNSGTTQARWALVTGASAGIGAAFARELACRGNHLVLTARRLDRLETLAAELRNAHGVEIECVSADLADADAPRALLAEVSRRGIHIDILINNAGYGVPGKLTKPAWSTHVDFIQVLMTTPVELCYLLLPGMQQAGYGRIINIASLAGLVPAPAGHTLYAASKAFLIKVSQALALENEAFGVRVCAVCPGFTYSEFHDVTGTREQMKGMPKWLWMDAAEVAHDGLDAIERGAIVRVSGRVNRGIKRLVKLLPDGLALRLMARRSKDFRNAD